MTDGATRDPSAGVEATVVIPTLDGDRYLDAALRAIARQDFPGGIEVLVIDSGSTDRTLDIVRAHPGVRLHRIPPAEFGHGRTRNLGARLARGRIVAFLTQDAIPAGPRWLAELVAPLDAGDAVAVVGRQIPRARCFPLMKYDIVSTFRAQGPDGETTVVSLPRDAGPADLDRLGFYSDVNSATTRQFLVDVLPYRDVPYSEDVAFARDLLRAGHRKAYAGRAAVIHSNDLGVRAYAARIAEETEALGRTGAVLHEYGTAGMIARAGWGVLQDSRRILADPDYGTAQRLGWLLRNPPYHAARWIGYARGLASLNA